MSLEAAARAGRASSAVARNYGEVLFELASREGAEEDYGELLEQIVFVYEGSRDFQRFLDTPRVSLKEKKEVLRKVLGDYAPDSFLHFLFLVLEKQRHRALSEIAEAYRDLVDQREGRVRASIVLAYEPDEEVRAEIVQGLERVVGSKVLPHFRREPALIGGAVVRMGDLLLDGSLRRRLEVLRRSLLSRKLPQE